MSETLWPDFQEAFVHSTTRAGYWPERVMGRRLRPFSVYHAFWLEVMEVPLWRGGNGRKATLADLDLAARICASSPALPFEPRRPGRLAKWRFLVHAWRGQEQMRRWSDYLADYLSPPHRTNKMESGFDPNDPLCRMGVLKKDRRVGRHYADLPDPLMLVAGLMHHGRLGYEQAWSMAFSEAEWLLAALQLQSGLTINVSTEHDREFMKGLGVGMWKKSEGRDQKAEVRD